MQTSDPQDLPDPQAAWEAGCSSALTRDLIWKLQAYRASMFLLHLATGMRSGCGRGSGAGSPINSRALRRR